MVFLPLTVLFTIDDVVNQILGFVQYMVRKLYAVQ